jgi:hypothetical protein
MAANSGHLTSRRVLEIVCRAEIDIFGGSPRCRANGRKS